MAVQFEVFIMKNVFTTKTQSAQRFYSPLSDKRIPDRDGYRSPFVRFMSLCILSGNVCFMMNRSETRNKKDYEKTLLPKNVFQNMKSIPMMISRIRAEWVFKVLCVLCAFVVNSNFINIQDNE